MTRPPLLRDELGIAISPRVVMHRIRNSLPVEYREWFDWTARMAGFGDLRPWSEVLTDQLADIESEVDRSLPLLQRK